MRIAQSRKQLAAITLAGGVLAMVGFSGHPSALASAGQAASDEVPPVFVQDGGAESAAVIAAATLTTNVFFVPADSDGTGTVVALYNATAVSKNVVVNGFVAGGVLGYSLTVAVPAGTTLRLVSDSLAATPPPSWANSVVTNFTDFINYVRLTVPKGVRLDGYTIFNPGTGTIDPRADQGAIPLRFSTTQP